MVSKPINVYWHDKYIYLGNFPEAEGKQKRDRAYDLMKTWKNEMKPKPSIEWVTKQLEDMKVRVIKNQKLSFKKSAAFSADRRMSIVEASVIKMVNGIATWEGKQIYLGTFPETEALEKRKKANALMKKWKKEIQPKPSYEWVMKQLENRGLRVSVTSTVRKEVFTSWERKHIYLGIFPEAEALEKRKNANALVKKWKNEIEPKPSYEWVIKQLENRGLRVVTNPRMIRMNHVGSEEYQHCAKTKLSKQSHVIITQDDEDDDHSSSSRSYSSSDASSSCSVDEDEEEDSYTPNEEEIIQDIDDDNDSIYMNSSFGDLVDMIKQLKSEKSTLQEECTKLKRKVQSDSIMSKLGNENKKLKSKLATVESERDVWKRQLMDMKSKLKALYDEY